MLVLCRKLGEEIVIGDDVVISVLSIRGNRVRLGIQAPEEISVQRREIAFRVQENENRTSVPISPPCAAN